MQPPDDDVDISSKLAKVGAVGVGLRADGDIDSGALAQHWLKLHAYELAEPALEPVSLHGGVLMLRHDDSDARMIERGSKYPDVEVRGPDSLPLSNDGQYVATPREPERTRKSEAVVRRLRISWAV